MADALLSRRSCRVAAWVVVSVVLAGPLCCDLAGSEVDSPQANIVFILVDDLGWADLPINGNKFHETPHVDRLAAEGMNFTDFYAACPVCSPTRATIQSGQYTPRVQITNFIPGHWRPFEKLVEPPIASELALNVVTIAEALHEAGYTAGHFGKWHLGGPTHFPDKQGYDVSVVTGGRHFGSRVVSAPPKNLPRETYRADFLTERAIDFIKENRSRPFFVHLSYHLVHIPLEAKADQIKKYTDKPKPPEGINHPVYAAMVAHVDEGLGRVMEALDRLELADSTVLIFTSDNGGLRRRYDGQGDLVTSNAPLRDEKGSLYEGGIRVPLVVRWPGVVRPGTVCREPVISVDFYPTMLEVAGLKPPAAAVLDGVSIVPLLKQSGGLGREAIYFHYPHYHHSTPAGAIRAGRWKLIEFFDDGALELYDLQEDLGETANLAAKMPQKAEELRAKLAAWRRSVGAAMPSVNPEHDPARAGEWWSRRTKKPLDVGR